MWVLLARSIGGRDVRAALEQLLARHGRPQVLRSDYGREFIAASLGESPITSPIPRAALD